MSRAKNYQPISTYLKPNGRQKHISPKSCLTGDRTDGTFAQMSSSYTQYIFIYFQQYLFTLFFEGWLIFFFQSVQLGVIQCIHIVVPPPIPFTSKHNTLKENPMPIKQSLLISPSKPWALTTICPLWTHLFCLSYKWNHTRRNLLYLTSFTSHVFQVDLRYTTHEYFIPS